MPVYSELVRGCERVDKVYTRSGRRNAAIREQWTCEQPICRGLARGRVDAESTASPDKPAVTCTSKRIATQAGKSLLWPETGVRRAEVGARIVAITRVFATHANRVHACASVASVVGDKTVRQTGSGEGRLALRAIRLSSCRSVPQKPVCRTVCRPPPDASSRKVNPDLMRRPVIGLATAMIARLGGDALEVRPPRACPAAG